MHLLEPLLNKRLGVQRIHDRRRRLRRSRLPPRRLPPRRLPQCRLARRNPAKQNHRRPKIAGQKKNFLFESPVSPSSRESSVEDCLGNFFSNGFWKTIPDGSLVLRRAE